MHGVKKQTTISTETSKRERRIQAIEWKADKIMESSFRGGSPTISEGSSSTETLRRSPGNVTTDTVSSNASV